MGADRIAGIAQATNALDPDLIVLLGDYVAGHALVRRQVPWQAWGDALSILRAPLGVHAILGNHDWWEDPDAMARRSGQALRFTKTMPSNLRRLDKVSGLQALAISLPFSPPVVWTARPALDWRTYPARWPR